MWREVASERVREGDGQCQREKKIERKLEKRKKERDERMMIEIKEEREIE